jgi:hypothetical protein
MRILFGFCYHLIPSYVSSVITSGPARRLFGRLRQGAEYSGNGSEFNPPEVKNIPPEKMVYPLD